MLTNKNSYKKDNLRVIQKTFNDGVCEIYTTNEREVLLLKGKFFYAQESVGISHYFQAYNNNISVDTSISIPCNNITVDSQDLVKIDSTWYKVVRIQYHDNLRPFYWTLSLQKSQFSYTEAVQNEND